MNALRRIVLAGWIIAGMFGSAALADDAPAATDPIIALRRNRDEIEEKIRQAVREERVTFKFEDTPLTEALQTLCEQADIRSSRLDEKAVMEEGIATDEPINQALTDVTLENALNICLEPLGLTWIVKNEMLVVTTQVKAEEIRTRKLYDIRDLRPVFAAAAGQKSPRPPGRSTILPGTIDEYPGGVRSLIGLLMEQTSGPWEDTDGTGGRLVPLGPTLLVQQTERVHAETRRILRIVRHFLKSPVQGSMMPFHGSDQDAEDWRRHWTALGKVIEPPEFKETPLHEVFAKLTEQNQATFILDEVALMEEGIARDEPITFSGGRMTLNSAVSAMLTPYGLTIVLEDGVIKVTTEVKADEKRTSLLYDVRDLLEKGLSESDLADLLEQETKGPWQNTEGTGGTISVPLPGALVISQTQKIQWEISELLDEYRRKIADAGDWKNVADRESAASMPIVRFYSLDRKGLAEPMRAALLDLVEPKTWEGNGGEGTIRRVEETLVIRQSPAVHKQILIFLKSFRESEDAPVLTSPATPAFRGF